MLATRRYRSGFPTCAIGSDLDFWQSGRYQITSQALYNRTMIILETERLTVRYLSVETDLEFVLRLLNEPSFLQYIGDKEVRTLNDAREYLLNGPIASYEKHGFGLYLVQLKNTGLPIGICGLIKRDTLADVDIGFALLPEFWNNGYTTEAAAAVFTYARDVLKIDRIVAITSPDNEASARVLNKLGLTFERVVDLGDAKPVKLFTPSDPIIKGADQSGNQ
jgi:RimJ/RimL family protein N-acetyltransferase